MVRGNHKTEDSITARVESNPWQRLNNKELKPIVFKKYFPTDTKEDTFVELEFFFRVLCSFMLIFTVNSRANFRSNKRRETT